MTDIKTIVVVDDHPLFREALASYLSKQTGFEVVGEAATGEEGISKARELNPDLVIIDISLPDMGGIDAVRQIRHSRPQAGVIMLSMHTGVDYMKNAFRAGASGYITKDSPGEKLIECLQTVTKGELYMDPAFSNSVVTHLLLSEKKGTYFTQDPSYSTLTPREQEIFRLMAEGLSAGQIGEKLFITQETVENHRADIFRKLDISSHIELLRCAAQYGIIDVEL